MVPDKPLEVFRNPENGVAFAIGMVGVVAVAGVLLVALLVGLPLLAPLPLIGGLAASALLNRAFREARLAAHESGLRVQNPLSDRWIKWNDIEGFDGGRFLLVRLRSGETVTVWAVQTANGQLLRKRGGYAEEVAARLAELRQRLA
jgi:hypothetical protein